MRVASDLRFSVVADGRPPASGTVTGDGDRLVLRTEDPVAVWRAALGSPATGPAALRAAAGALDEAGVSLRVVGLDGLLADIEAGATSVVGRLALGAPHVRLGSPRALLPLGRAQLARWSRMHRPLLAGAVPAACPAAAWVLVMRRPAR